MLLTISIIFFGEQYPCFHKNIWDPLKNEMDHIKELSL